MNSTSALSSLPQSGHFAVRSNYSTARSDGEHVTFTHRPSASIWLSGSQMCPKEETSGQTIAFGNPAQEMSPRGSDQRSISDRICRQELLNVLIRSQLLGRHGFYSPRGGCIIFGL